MPMTGFRMPEKSALIKVLHDLEKPIAQRMRAIFYLRTVGGDDAVAALATALRNRGGSTLFRHEIAYVLGQMQATTAVPALLEVLQDASDDPIVRHESGEALGAIGDPSTLSVLEALSSDPRPEVAETCQIAADRVRWAMSSAADKDAPRENPFESVDPAPALKAPKTKDEIVAMQATLMNTSLPLFERYRAMFSLRNAGTKGAVLALCTGLTDVSPLFRHEVAYVLGQLAHPASVPALQTAVLNATEHDMVRHEAAEALGAVGTGECEEFLQKYTSDSAQMLRESCVVALDIADYWSSYASADEGVASGGAAVSS